MANQDWFLRQLENMATALGMAILGGHSELTQFRLEEVTANQAYLSSLMGEGQFNEIENYLFELKEKGDPEAATLAWWFYDYLRTLSEEELQQNNFSSEEIDQGLRDFFGAEVST